MSTFSEMANEWLRQNLPANEPLQAATKATEATKGSPATPLTAQSTPAVNHIPNDPTARRVEVSRWLAACCTCSPRVWGAAKFLYHDYCEWCQQSGQPAISAEQFVAILDTSFSREQDGWQGLCLAVDFMATTRVQ